MATDKQSSNVPSGPDQDHPSKLSKDEASAINHPPVEQTNPDHKGLNPDHLGPAQPRKPGE
jgi:hypothetical protein